MSHTYEMILHFDGAEPAKQSFKKDKGKAISTYKSTKFNNGVIHIELIRDGESWRNKYLVR